MNGPMSGDIFPAREAIDLIDQIDLGLPLEIPPLPPEAEPKNVPSEEHRWLLGEIARLKKEKNAYILAHNYAPSDIQDVSDAVGDSLYLAQKGAESDAEILLEASVLFMNQILAIMKKPHQRVLAPDLGALCSLAAHADVDKIGRWKQEHPDGIVISYVNTYLDVKAASDYCCASANASGHSPRVGIFGTEPADSFSAGCLFRILRGEIIRAAKTTAGPAMADDGRVPRARSHSSLSCRAATAVLSQRSGGGPSRVRLHERLHAPDGARENACGDDAVSFDPRDGAIRARHAAKSRHHGDRGREYLSTFKSGAGQDYRTGEP